MLKSPYEILLLPITKRGEPKMSLRAQAALSGNTFITEPPAALQPGGTRADLGTEAVVESHRFSL